MSSELHTCIGDEDTISTKQPMERKGEIILRTELLIYNIHL